MKIRNTFIALLSVLTISSVFLTSGCKKDDDDTPRQTSYDLKTKDVLGINGKVTFIETSSTETTIEIQLNGISSGEHPAHIHANSAVEGGSITISLNPVDATGKSTTVVTKQDNNNAINYTQLIAYDGYLNVHESSTNLGTIIAQGDIGGNALTSTSTTYNLSQVNASGVAGTALFQKRVNGTTLVTLSLTGTIASGDHPSHIHLGSVATVGGGPIVVTLNNVNGATGKSYTNIRDLDNGTVITYDNLLVYDGYINVHLSMLTLGTILAQGNIGSNV